MNQALLAALLTAGGAIGLAIVNHFLTSGRDKFDVATQIREELRKDNATLRQEIKDVQKELSLFKDKCYALLEKQGKLEIANSDLTADVIRLKQVLKDNHITGFV